MLESELFDLLENTADAVYAVTAAGLVRAWNGAAERLFGYARAEALNRNIDDIFEARDSLGTSALSGGMEAATRNVRGTDGVPHFDLEVRTKAGERIWINVSTVVFDNPRTGHRLLVRLARDVSERHRRDHLYERVVEVARQIVASVQDEDATDHAPVEPLSDQERRILTLFADGSNPAAITRELNISPQTLRNHLHHINRKLRTHNRLEAVTHAQRRGLIGQRP
ncbi:MAG TPA: PAS domain S-box protein [Longimicrobiales bacterium]